MVFGVWNSARANKENILYAVLTVVLLERVRGAWNRAERRHENPTALARHRGRLVLKASLLYALPLLLPVVKYIYRSVAELSWTVPGLSVMRETWVFWGVVVAVEVLLAFAIYQLLHIYIERMNSALGFFSRIGRNMRDGSRTVARAGGAVTGEVTDRVRTVSNGVSGASRRVVSWTGRGAAAVPWLVAGFARGVAAAPSLLVHSGRAGVARTRVLAGLARRWKRRPPPPSGAVPAQGESRDAREVA